MVGVCEPSSCWGSPLLCHPSRRLCCPHPLTVVPALARLLSRAVTCPGLVFTLHRRGHRWWCCCRRLCRGYRCAPGCRLYCGPARRNIISALKMERKNNSRGGPGGVTSQPRRWSPLWSPRTHRCGAAGLLLSLPLPPWSCLGGGGHFRRCCTS
jgi:hypothetical protein